MIILGQLVCSRHLCLKVRRDRWHRRRSMLLGPLWILETRRFHSGIAALMLNLKCFVEHTLKLDRHQQKAMHTILHLQKHNLTNFKYPC